MKFILIHGSYGHPDENWFPWLREQLESEDHTVFAPTLPTPPQQDLVSWWEVINKNYLELIDENTILIGHSLGPAFILTILERIKLRKPIPACMFVSGFVESLNNEKFDAVNKTFTEKEFNWNNIKSNCSQFVMFHGSNDPYVPISAAQNLATKLETQAIIIQNGGHLNEAAGYAEFPELLNKIRELISVEHQEE